MIPEVTIDRLIQYKGHILVYLLHKSEVLTSRDLPYLDAPIEAVWYRCVQGECWYIFPVSVMEEEVIVGALFKRHVRRLKVKPSYVPNDRSQLPRGVPYFEAVADSLDGDWYRIDVNPNDVKGVEVRGRWLLLDLHGAKVGVKMPCIIRTIYMCKDGDENPFTCNDFFYVECARKTIQGI